MSLLYKSKYKNVILEDEHCCLVFNSYTEAAIFLGYSRAGFAVYVNSDKKIKNYKINTRTTWLNIEKCRFCCVLLDESTAVKSKQKKSGFVNLCKPCKLTKFENAPIYKKTRYEKIKHLRKVGKYKNAFPETERAIRARRRAAKLNATLDNRWNKEIKEIYKQARLLQETTGEAYHVDHIIPLQGENICGLHVPWNLRPIKAIDNIRKGNKLCQF